MAKLINQEDSIEGEKVLINTRKQITQSPVKRKGIRLFKYKCSRHSKTEITEELNPKKFKIKEISALNLGDLLEADVIEVYPSNMLRFVKESGYSSKHSIQTAESKSFTFAEIAIPFRFTLSRVKYNSVT